MADSLIHVLKNLICHKLTSMFDYQNVQLPWLQIKIIKCLGMLAMTDEG